MRTLCFLSRMVKLFSQKSPKLKRTIVTRGMVLEANERMQGRDVRVKHDVYQVHGLQRPTRQEIAEAGARAMREMRA